MKFKTPSIKVLLTLLFTSAALTACGGGDSSSPGTVGTPPAMVDTGNGNITLVTADSNEDCDIPAT